MMPSKMSGMKGKMMSSKTMEKQRRAFDRWESNGKIEGLC